MDDAPLRCYIHDADHPCEACARELELSRQARAAAAIARLDQGNAGQ